MKKSIELKDLGLYCISVIVGLGIFGLIVKDLDFTLIGILFSISGASLFYFLWGKNIPQ